MRTGKKIFGYVYASRCVVLAFSLFIIFSPARCRADENVIEHFTQSLVTVYSASSACQNTIAPGPQEYIYLIATYLMKLYPNGVDYWVIPKKVNAISDPVTCIRLIQNHLLDYKNAMIEYNKNYPLRNPPPILIAYQWDNTYFEIQPVEPTKSYAPASKKAVNKTPIKEKFSAPLSQLQ